MERGEAPVSKNRKHRRSLYLGSAVGKATYCEVCCIECGHVKNLEQHKLGKKHKKAHHEAENRKEREAKNDDVSGRDNNNNGKRSSNNKKRKDRELSAFLAKFPRGNSFHHTKASRQQKSDSTTETRMANPHQMTNEEARDEDRILDKSVMVADLAQHLQDLLFDEYAAKLIRGTPELATIFREVSRRYPQHLRLKEFFESAETFLRIEMEIQQQRKRNKEDSNLLDKEHTYQQQQQEQQQRIIDVACGHGLVSILLAYRYPDKQVLGIDTQRRKGWDSVVSVFREMGVPSKKKQEKIAMENLEFVESDFRDLSSSTTALQKSDFLICIHGCNEVTTDALAMAIKAGCSWCVEPCCIRDGVVMETALRHLDQDTRYAVLCGVLAERFGAHRITAIDPIITNRNVLLFGRPSSSFSSGETEEC